MNIKTHSSEKRPPAIGQECISDSQSSTSPPKRSMNEADGKSDQGSRWEVHKLVQADGDTSGDFKETKSMPSCLKWAESLDILLQNSDGVALFKKYLESESCGNALDFWFACQGFKHSVDPNDSQKIYQLIKVIYRTYVRSTASSDKQGVNVISPETRKAISERIAHKQDLDQTIFDEAQTEVQHRLRHTLYPAFLKSDLYVGYVAAEGDNCDNDSAHVYHHLSGLPLSESDSDASFSMHREPTRHDSPHRHQGMALATLEEDREMHTHELHMPSSTSAHLCTPGVTASRGQSPAPLTSENLLVTRFYRAELSYRKPEVNAGTYLQPEVPSQSLPNPYHVSFAPVSTQDSELQSLSSDAQTDDTRSLTDNSSLDGSSHLFPMQSKKKWKHQRRAIRRSAQHNRESSTGLWQTLIPRTQPVDSDSSRSQGTGLSASISTNQSQQAVTAQPIKSKERNLAESNPKEFVNLLTEKLNKLIEEKGKMNKIERLFHQMSANQDDSVVHQHSSSGKQRHDSISSSSNSALLKQPWAGRLMAAAREQEDAQAILEDHCSRIWNKSAEQTPPTGSRSPYPNTTIFSTSTSFSSSSAGGTSQQHQHRHVHHHPPVHLYPGAGVSDHHHNQPAAAVPPTDGNMAVQHRNDKVRVWIYESSNSNHDQHHAHRTAAASHRVSASNSGPTTNPRSRDQRQQLSRHSPGMHETGPVIHKDSHHKNRSAGHSATAGSGSHSSGSRSESNRSSTPAVADLVSASACGEGLIVGYYLMGDPVPYRTNWTLSKEITLGQFKTLTAKKGNYRYFFKKACDEFETGVVQEEISNDDAILPLWEGKVVAKIEKID